MTGKLEIGPDGRVTGPVAITYNNPFPTSNGSWGSGAMMGGAAWGGHTCPGPGPRASQRYEIISRAAAIRAGQVAWTSDGSLSLNDLAAQLKTEASSDPPNDRDP